MKKDNIIITTRKAGDPIDRGQTDLSQLKKMSEQDIDRRALDDPDNPPVTGETLCAFKPACDVSDIDIRKIRARLHLSQNEFARYFGVSVRTLQDWEQRRHSPSRMARNFLVVIAKEPQAVQRALINQNQDAA